MKQILRVKNVKTGTITKFEISLQHDADGFFAACEALQGCHTQADTYNELADNLEDVVLLHLQDRYDDKFEVLGRNR